MRDLSVCDSRSSGNGLLTLARCVRPRLRVALALFSSAFLIAASATRVDAQSAEQSDKSTEPAGSSQTETAQPKVSLPSKPRYTTRRIHDPNGIGKFYMGREIAHVMGYQGVIWLEREEREQEEAPSKLVAELKLQKGQVIADIGAGSGVLSVMMAREVGEDGRVIAVDVQQEMLDLLDRKLQMLGVKNVEGRLGTEKTPQLEPESIDLAIMVDVYHEFAFPYEMMLEISKAIKPGGRVVLVEYRKEDPNVPIKLVHKMTQAQVKKEMNQPEFGLKWKETIGSLPRQHVIIFEKLAPPDAGKNPQTDTEPPKAP